MDKKELINEEIRKVDLAIVGVNEDIEKYTILEEQVRVEHKKKILRYLQEDKEKYEKMLAELE